MVPYLRGTPNTDHWPLLLGFGFILLRTGFFLAGISSQVPPAFSIFFLGGLGEVVRLHGELLGKLAVAEDAEPVEAADDEGEIP